MISIRLPSRRSTLSLLDSLADTPFSYAEVGATRDTPPTGYNIDRYSKVIGRGSSSFTAAQSAIRSWTPFALPWIQSYPQGEPHVGCTVAVVVRTFGLWWTNVCRVVYTVDEPNRFGFAYGTLNNHHAETGEERFLVEFDSDTGDVTYSVLAFSRPQHPLAKMGYPLSRMAQRRFGAETVDAMRDEVARLDV